MHNFKLISEILPVNCIFYELETNQIYTFKNIIIYNQFIYNIYTHIYLIDKLNINIIKKKII
jgi:hypothetical protein